MIVKSFKAVTAALLLAFSALPARGQAAWRRLSDEADNFSVLLPVAPQLEARGNFTLGYNGVQVDTERIATAYHNGVVYIVRMYEAPGVKKFFARYPEIYHLKEAAESTVGAGGAEGKQYVRKGEGHTHVVRLFHTKKRLYVLEAASRSEPHPDVEKFFASLVLGDATAAAANAGGTSAGGGAEVRVAPAGTEPLTEKEVGRPAVIVYKPQPSYPASAKGMQVSGKVRLRLLLSQTGEATVVKVLSGMTGWLAEASAAAARSLKFLPAEKDGRLVPQYAEIEYTFVLR